MQTITYIKKGEEHKTNSFIYSLFNKDRIYDQEKGKYEEDIYNISKEIELLHLKNFTFRQITLFNCLNQDTILILDHCTFKNKAEIIGGCVSLDHPQYEKPCSIDFYDNEEVELILDQKETNQDDMKQPNRPKYQYGLYKVNNLVVTGNAQESTISQREGYISSVNIRNAKLSSFSCDTRLIKNMEIINSKVNWNSYTVGTIPTGKISIKDSYIKGEYALDLTKRESDQVVVKDSVMEATMTFLPNGKTSSDCRENDILEFSSTDENATGNLLSARLSFISLLKTVAEAENKTSKETLAKISEQIKEMYASNIERHHQEMKRYESLIATEKTAISNLEEERDDALKEISTSVGNQKVKLLQKKNG